MRVTKPTFLLITPILIAICVCSCKNPLISTGDAGSIIFVKGNDNAPMVWIEEGEFVMGSPSNSFGNFPVHPSELPEHTVYLNAFYIDVFEVTVDQYTKFMNATGHKPTKFWADLWDKENSANLPIVGVTWDDANAYANWVGKRLPTEAEWEKAARGGLIKNHFPWGNEITHNDANYEGSEDNSKDEFVNTSPVICFAPNGYGLYNMAGNVMEWCADWYGSDYYTKSPRENPKGPDSGHLRVLRGGSYKDIPFYLRASSRSFDYPLDEESWIGFRCAAD